MYPPRGLLPTNDTVGEKDSSGFEQYSKTLLWCVSCVWSVRVMGDCNFLWIYVISIWISQLFWDLLTISWASSFPSHARSARYTFVKAPIRTEIRPKSWGWPAITIFDSFSVSAFTLFTPFDSRSLSNAQCELSHQGNSPPDYREMKWGRRAASKINSKDHFSKSTLITRRGATWRKVRQQKGNVLALRSAVGLVKELQVKRGELSQESSLHTQQQRLFLWLWWQVVGGWWPDLQGLPAGKAGFIRPLPLCFSSIITSASAWSTISLLLPLVHNHFCLCLCF